MAFIRKLERRILLIWFATVVCVAAQDSASTPGSIKPPAGETLVLRAHASGDQIYGCEASQWKLRGPDAHLVDDAGVAVGRHFAGPAWQWSDGSRVTGTPVASATPDPQSIPWLLLRVTAHEGDGTLKNVTSIQRLHTKGGKAPAEPCTAARENETVRVPYTADYYFFAARK